MPARYDRVIQGGGTNTRHNQLRKVQASPRVSQQTPRFDSAQWSSLERTTSNKTVHPSPRPIIDVREKETIARVAAPEGPWWGPDNFAPLGGPPPPTEKKPPTRRIPRIVPLGKFAAGEEDQRPLSAREAIMYTARAFEREYGLEFGAAAGARTSRTAREGRGSQMKQVLQGKNTGKQPARMSMFEGSAKNDRPDLWDDRRESEVFDDGARGGPISQAEAKNAAAEPKTPPVSRSTRRARQDTDGAAIDWKAQQQELYARLATKFTTKRDVFLCLDKDRDAQINRDDLGGAFEGINVRRPPTGLLDGLCQLDEGKEGGMAIFAKPKFKRGRRPSITEIHDPEEELKNQERAQRKQGPGLDYESFCKQLEDPPTIASVILGWRPDTAYRKLWGIEGDPSTRGKVKSNGKENTPGTKDAENKRDSGKGNQHLDEGGDSNKASKRGRRDDPRREQMVRAWHRRFAAKQPSAKQRFEDFLHEKEAHRMAEQAMEDAKRRAEMAKQKEIDRLMGVRSSP